MMCQLMFQQLRKLVRDTVVHRCLNSQVNISCRRLADGPRYAVYPPKSYQLPHETQLPHSECAMLRVTMNGQKRRPRKLSDRCMAALHVDHIGVTNTS